MAYGHADVLLTLPVCKDCRLKPGWFHSDVDQRPLCGGCTVVEQRL